MSDRNIDKRKEAMEEYIRRSENSINSLMEENRKLKQENERFMRVSTEAVGKIQEGINSFKKST
uniref:Uncharacterized protein n=1 Tax=Acrobeloides nanus TaxID=290746 RepID=A0A914ER83_9BILA